MLHPILDEALDDLLAAWRHHEVLRANSRIGVVRLATSRIKLDNARRRVHAFRQAMYPNEHEQESIAISVVCPTLEHLVHIPESKLTRTTSGLTQFLCPCGEVVRREPARDREIADPPVS